MSEDLDDDFVVYDDNLGKEVARRLTKEIPREHQKSNDTRIMWLWSQRLAVVQQIKMQSPDVQDQMAATLVLTAAMAAYLPSIELVLRRLEGGAIPDEEVVEQDSMPV